MRPRFSIALLSEDSSEPTWRGLRAIVQKLLNRFEENGYTPRVELVPVDDDIRPVLIANQWRSTKAKDERKKRDLWHYIARKIAEPGGFVVFHYDGDTDTTWSRRAEAKTPAQFDREVRTRVAQVLAGKHSPDEIAQKLERIIECVPFYSTEAWTYQATERAIALCREKHRCADATTFEAWGADRTKLDDVPKPKEKTCLGGEHNEVLGKSVAVWDVVQTGGSMMWFVWNLHACRALEDALALPSSGP
ncbi:hypothetical protein [Polyangium mundeleinium]|uniref:DUF4276 family protein n=1 Tax=Polyangium mundeleinium TaxID=2995306 RepID=A0ABT5EJ48_9BACT|nr:hypothetical protein [Polyangium mundeleinium]MDC0741374.1 hypothetical protein [Polyangium mundeleinium]